MKGIGRCPRERPYQTRRDHVGERKAFVNDTVPDIKMSCNFTFILNRTVDCSCVITTPAASHFDTSIAVISFRKTSIVTHH